MTHAMRVHQTGGPDVLTWEAVDIGAPGPNEIRIRQTAIGLNYIDTYFRTGLYPAPHMPFIPGCEAAGIVTQVGPGVTAFKVGDRVAYYLQLGAYAQERIAPVKGVIKLPDDVSDEQAAVLMLKGLTTHYLIFKSFKVQPGHIILVHAAAGGVGLLLSQWAKALGAYVIGTAGSRDKADLARANGCDEVILYRDEDFVARVKEITKGELCHVVYDGVGKDTFPGSLDCIRPRGYFVTFGNASGPVPPFSLFELTKRGSLYATRPTLGEFVKDQSEMDESIAQVFDALRRGQIKVQINHRYALKDAAQAHSDLESRKTTGAVILLP